MSFSDKITLRSLRSLRRLMLGSSASLEKIGSVASLTVARFSASISIVLLFGAIFSAAGADQVISKDFTDFSELNLEDLLNQKVVTASRYEQKLSEAPAKMIVWTREMIRQSGFQTLEDVLTNTPGFFYSFCADYGLYSVRAMHPIAPGLPQPNILFMLDGIRLNEATFYGHYYSYYHNMDNVERVEIILGPGGALYGLNALSGVVNIITRRPMAQTGRSFHVSQSFESGVNKATPFVSLDMRRTNGLGLFGSLTLPSIAEGDWDTGTDQLGTVDWYLKSPWHHGLEREGEFVPNWDLRLQYKEFEFFTYRSSVLYNEFNVPWWDITAKRERSFERRIYDLAWRPAFWNSEFHANFNQHYDFQQVYDGHTLWAPYDPTPNPDLAAFAEVNEYLFSAQLNPLQNDKNRLLVAAELSSASRKNQFLGGPRNLDQLRYSALAQYDHRFGDKLTVVVGLRYDAVDIDSKNKAQNEAKVIDLFDALSPRLSVLYHLNDKHRLRLIAARATRQFVLGDFTDQQFAKKDDTVDDYELGYSGQLTPNVLLDLNGYLMRAPHSSLYTNDNFFPPEGRTKFDGAGIEADLTAQVNNYETRLGFTWWRGQTGQLDEAGIDQMLNTPDMMLKASVRGPLLTNKVNFAMLVNGNFNLLHVDDLSETHKVMWSYTPVDLIFTSDPRLSSRYEFTLGLKNLFNERFYYPGYGYNAPFSDWNYPDYMLTESRVKHPGLSVYGKVGVSF